MRCSSVHRIMPYTWRRFIDFRTLRCRQNVEQTAKQGSKHSVIQSVCIYICIYWFGSAYECETPEACYTYDCRLNSIYVECAFVVSYPAFTYNFYIIDKQFQKYPFELIVLCLFGYLWWHQNRQQQMARQLLHDQRAQ